MGCQVFFERILLRNFRFLACDLTVTHSLVMISRLNYLVVYSSVSPLLKEAFRGVESPEVFSTWGSPKMGLTPQKCLDKYTNRLVFSKVFR